MKKKLFSTGTIVLFMAITIYIFATSKEIGALPKMVKDIQIHWLIMAASLMGLFYIFNTLILHKISHEIRHPLSLKGALYMSFVGQYYSLITPFATGGQPAQVYAMQKKGMAYQ